MGFDLDADALLSEMADELLYHGDLNAAMRRMLQQGFQDRNGEQLMGMQEMLKRLRERRQQELEQRDLGGVYDDIAEKLNDVMEHERAGMDRRVQEARAGDDERRREIVEQLAQERGLELDLVPDDLAGRVQALQNYDFMDDAARAEFEGLMDELRQQLMQSYFNQMSEGMQNVAPEQLARMKDMLASLNQMLEQRERGEEPDFEKFMEDFGDFFPGNPETLDELLEQMAQSMAAMQQLLNSMTPEQRAQIQQLADSLLEDMDLQWQMASSAAICNRHFRTCRGVSRWTSVATSRCRWGRCRVCSRPSGTSTDSSRCCRASPNRVSSPRSTSTKHGTCSATMWHGRSSGCKTWRRCSRTPV